MHSDDCNPNFLRVAPERVARGAAILDRKRPGWAHEISTISLKMNNHDKCVLGQLYGRYWTGVSKLKLNQGRESATRLGFTLGFSDISDMRYDELLAWDALDACWKDAVQERQSQPVPLRAKLRMLWQKTAVTV